MEETVIRGKRDLLYMGIIVGFAVLLAVGVLINTPR
jgi:hypothetical protein